MALLDLVAIGTIADIAPLLGENHTLVRLGMQRLNTTQKPGLLALIRNANLQLGRIRERDVAYSLAPRINAAGRMKEASIAFQLLTTDREEEAAAYVDELEQLNITRQQQTEELMRNVRAQAQNQPTKQVVLVNGDGWHEGIIGLVAGKLAEEISKPVLVLSNDLETRLSRGSARSQKGFNMIAALCGFSARLERYGGHAQAAGFTIQSERIAELHNHLLGWKEESIVTLPVSSEVTENSDSTEVVVEPETIFAAHQQKIDIVFTKMERLNYALYKSVRALAPFGASYPEPLFKMEGVRLLDKWTSGKDRQNLRLRLAASNGNTIQRMGTLTRGAVLLPSLEGIARVNILFRLESSEDESKQDVWLKLLEVEAVNEAKFR
jgi:single-stranded-DNA-specific exonuclease